MDGWTDGGIPQSRLFHIRKSRPHRILRFLIGWGGDLKTYKYVYVRIGKHKKEYSLPGTKRACMCSAIANRSMAASLNASLTWNCARHFFAWFSRTARCFFLAFATAHIVSYCATESSEYMMDCAISIFSRFVAFSSLARRHKGCLQKPSLLASTSAFERSSRCPM